jgi:morphogenetic protein associated with SpoVID
VKIHMVKKGDTLFDLSKKYGISLEKLIESNPQLLDPSKLNVGDKVKIPSKSVSVSEPEDIIHKHVVKQGDSLWKISKAWGVSLKDMIDANTHLKNPNALLVGEVVNVPKVAMNEVINNESTEGKVGEEKNTQGGKAYTGTKTDTSPVQSLPPVIPQLPQLPVNPAPMIQTSIPEIPNAPTQSYESNEEKVEMSQHLFIQFPVPAQEVVAQSPNMEKSQPCPVLSDHTTYPGITEGYSYIQPEYEQPCYEQPYYEEPCYEQQAYWQQPNSVQSPYVQHSYPEMQQMSHKVPDYCYPNISDYNTPFQENGSGYSYGGYGENPLTVSNVTNPKYLAPATDSNVYSYTSPYEWTYPQQNVMGGHPLTPNMAYGVNSSFSPQQTVVQDTKDCGCHDREQNSVLNDQRIPQVSFNEITQENVVSRDESNLSTEGEEIKSVNRLQTAQTSSVNKGKERSGNQVEKAVRKKENKPSKVQHKRRNPWIRN